MSLQLAAAAISAFVALVSIVLSARTAKSNTKFKSDLDQQNDEFRSELQRKNDEFRTRLEDELQQRRDQASKAARLEEIMGRYRDPLLSAAFELQSRIYNFVRRGFAGYLIRGDEGERSYAINSTLFIIAQYLAWAEALRRGIQFLDLGDVERSRELADHLETIRATFSTDTVLRGPFRIFRTEQRAIGEIMLEPSLAAQSGDVPWQCKGYAAFCSSIERDKTFASWFTRLDQEVRAFANGKPGGERLAALQNHLMDLIDFLDNPPLRFPVTLRSRIPLAPKLGPDPKNPSPSFTVGVDSIYTPKLGGSPAPIVSLSKGSVLPSGLYLDSETGVIAGKPAVDAVGEGYVTLRAKNGISPDAELTVRLNIVNS
jgi:hypothetical protein